MTRLLFEKGRISQKKEEKKAGLFTPKRKEKEGFVGQKEGKGRLQPDHQQGTYPSVTCHLGRAWTAWPRGDQSGVVDTVHS
jgi:hypothetical protein